MPHGESVDDKLRSRREATKRWRLKQKELAARGDARALAFLDRKRQADHERYMRVRSERLDQQRAAYAADPAPFLLRNRASYARNKERWRETRRAWYFAHHEEQKARRRELGRRMYQADPERWSEYLKGWRKDNPERQRAYARRESALRRGAVGADRVTLDEWSAVLWIWGQRCAYCGSTDHIEMDHRIPLRQGGRHIVANVLPACRRCNRSKNAKTEEEFRAMLAATRCWLIGSASRVAASESLVAQAAE